MTKFKINYDLLPIKAHFFFFMAAMGPILPFLPVYGKQLGISPMVMGSITAILPIFFLIAKPMFGLIIDYFRSCRKTLFTILLAATSATYILLYFLPALPNPVLPEDGFHDVPCSAPIELCDSKILETPETCFSGRRINCNWKCSEGLQSFNQGIYFASYHMGYLTNKSACLLPKIINDTVENRTGIDTPPSITNTSDQCLCNITCGNVDDDTMFQYCLYISPTFWGFVLLMCVGNIGFNVANSVSDAICFDVLGDGEQMGYGRQRVWGTIGFGVTAFLGGFAIDVWSHGEIKIYTPAFLLMFIFTCFDLLCCRKLELPIISGSNSILKDVWKLVRLKPIAIFMCFAIIIGIIDSFIIYFLFWYLEDLAATTGDMEQIKLIEGLIIAAATLGGEVIFFLFSGKILGKIGYSYSFVLCFFCYSLRLGLISLAPSPWWILPIEFFMQGPTYALGYTTVVAYASVVAPPGASATVQGLIAGMDDGLGFAVGSLVGGILYKQVGGARTLQIFSMLAGAASLAYLLLHLLYLRHVMPNTDNKEEIKYENPNDAAANTNHYETE